MGRLMRAASQAIMELVSSARIFNGVQNVYKHHSNLLGCDMNFAVYLPDTTKPVPVLIFLSGLTCTEQNVIQKGAFQQQAAHYGIAVVCPDTSPRGLNLPGEEDSWDFGTGAGFYVDATKAPFDKNYKMYSYVTKELPELLKANFSNLDMSRVSITGHSMGGHGALTLFLKNPGMYKSCSAFAPIVNPLNCPWGEKAFNGYFETGMKEGAAHDACELVKTFPNKCNILIDQGLKDGFYENQLKSNNILEAVKTNDKVHIDLRLQEGYDHSYYFISTFMPDHMDLHYNHLK